MKRNLARHEAEEIKERHRWTQWQAIQLKNLRKYRAEYSKIINRTFDDISPIIEQEIEAAYHSGLNSFDEQLVEAMDVKGIDVPHDKLPVYKSSLPIETRRLMQDQLHMERAVIDLPDKGTVTVDIEIEAPSDDSFFAVNERKIEALVKQVSTDMGKARYGAIRKAGADHEAVLREVDLQMQSGGITLDSAIERATKKLADAGLNCVEYENGRRVNLASYVEMALRTSSRRAVLDAEGAKRDEWGVYTVISPTLHSTCDTCQIWQGKVLIDDVYSKGKPDGKHPMLSEAIAPPSHFLGPNCRHPLVTYFEGITEIPTKSPFDQTQSMYLAEQKQRRLERQIRRWKRREIMAETDSEKMLARSRVEDNRQMLLQHLHDNPKLKRWRERESVLGLED